ncbi:MAG: hypothetical protein EBX41_06445 [Chitinophagia bacterium]|nr:hypothetical protein [Chitinophagia bacterium]
MLEAIAQGGGAQSQEAVQYEPITQNALTAYYTQFIDNLKTNEKETVYVYLNQTTIDLRDNGDVAIVAPSFFHESYVNSEKNNLNDFFKLKFGKYLNIKAEVHKPKEDNIASVSEIYKAMVAENPHLELLKNTLGLQIIG